MKAERAREIGARLREFYEFARRDVFDREVTVYDSEYSVDLGTFGTRYMEVELSETKEFDAEDIINSHYPVSVSEFDEFASELEAVATDVTALDVALERMEAEGSGALVSAIRSLVETFQGVGQKVIDLTGLSVGPLPPTPLPWPGALRDEIDYTAPDFPLRYQPPPGYQWTERGSYSSVPLTPADVKPYSVSEIPTGNGGDGKMILDSKGRVSWRNRADDNLKEGVRWPLWFLDRDGIPRATGGFNGPTPPLPIDRYGDVMDPDWADNNGNNTVWSSGQVDAAKKRVAEIIAAYEQSLGPKNEYGVSYDPVTIEVGASSRSLTEELRVGDFVSSYGRVLTVTRLSDGQYTCTFITQDGRTKTDTRPSYNWAMKPIIGVNRDAQPTALSLSGTAGAPETAIDYDPLTVPVKDEAILIKTSELRLGDDVTGARFGRVTKVNPDFSFEMNRDGTINNCDSSYGDVSWNVLPIDVADRDAVPAAITLPQPVEVAF